MLTPDAKPQPEFLLLAKAKDLVKHTDMMTSDKRFPKKYRFTLVNRLQERCLEIFENISEANDLNLLDGAERAERLRLQRRALTLCKTALFLVEVSHERGLITGAQTEAWARAVTDVKNMCARWHKQDKLRPWGIS